MSMMTTPAAPPATLDEALPIIASLQSENQHLKNEIAQFRRLIFGQKRERFVPAATATEEQMTLEGLLEQIGVKAPGFAETRERITYERRKPKGHGRKPIPDDLHREKHVLDVPESEKTCSCGSMKKHIGDDITEELEYKPAVFFVNQYIRPKYACPKCPEKGIATAQLPPRPIDKGIAGAGLLSYILVSKHVDHLPLYRLEQMFKRYEIHISRSTMDGWIAKICFNLQSVYDEMHRQLVTDSFIIQGDETTLKVMDDTVIDKCAIGYLWPFVGDGKLAVFEFRDTRSREGPSDFLKDFKERYLMSDGYAGYNQVIEHNRLLHLMCWAHARRKFFEAKALDPPFIEKVLALLGQLYDIEREARDMQPHERFALRQSKSKPLLDTLKSLLENPGTTLLPKSDVGIAVAYTLNHWEQLNRFLVDGRLPIDNNLVENTIRPVALGRKNWLFAGSPEGARRLAIIYSLAATCKLNNINFYEYLYDILPKIASYQAAKIADLTPMNWHRLKSG